MHARVSSLLLGFHGGRHRVCGGDDDESRGCGHALVHLLLLRVDVTTMSQLFLLPLECRLFQVTSEDESDCEDAMPSTRGSGAWSPVLGSRSR